MTKNYVAAGNTMIDNVKFVTGELNRKQLGGPAIFGFTGIKLWTDNVDLLSNVGKDMFQDFSDWINVNQINLEYFKALSDATTISNLEYLEDGTYRTSLYNQTEELLKMEKLGYMKTHPWQVEQLCQDKKIDALYIAQNNDLVFWEEINTIKKKHDFKIMWEIEGAICNPSELSKIYEVLEFIDIFSINLEEAQNLFGIKNEKEIVKKLSTLNIDVTVFRVGARGLYTISQGKCYFHPSVATEDVIDATGSGNSSTASALYSYTEEDDLIMIGTKANIASSINLKHFGAVKNIKSYRDYANNLSEKIYQEYDYENNDLSWWLQ